VDDAEIVIGRSQVAPVLHTVVPNLCTDPVTTVTDQAGWPGWATRG